MKKIFLLNLVFFAVYSVSAQIITESAPQPQPPLDGIVDRSELNRNKALPYTPIRAADVLWEKRIWRVIDTREKINLVFRYPEMPLYTLLENGIRTGELTAYETEDDKFTMPLSSEKLFESLYRKDTVEVIDPVTGKITFQEVEDQFDHDDVKRFRVKEVWYFDSNSSTMKVRILGIAPLLEVTREMTGQVYEKPLFWIYMPHARDYLARHQVFNPNNDFANMTWEDLFEMRMFSSYIMKESNVGDLRLEGYLSGVDLLLEGDRISQEIFNFENDLWSY